MRKFEYRLCCAPLLMACLVSAFVFSEPVLAADSLPTIKLGYVQDWPSSLVTTQLAATVIHDKLGYPVKLVAATPGVMFVAVAHARLDAMLSAWLPVDHKKYYLRVWNNVYNLGPNLIGTNLGLVVPKYVSINSITQLNEHADKFNHKIVGGGAGGGIEIDTRKAIKAYHLNFHLITSSTAAIASALQRAINRHEWVVVTGWSPLWIWGKFDLKFLNDPKHVYGHNGYVATLTSRKLPGKAPEVFAFLRRFRINLSTLNTIEARRKSGEKLDTVISNWIGKHPGTVAGWTTGLGDGAKRG